MKQAERNGACVQWCEVDCIRSSVRLERDIKMTPVFSSVKKIETFGQRDRKTNKLQQETYIQLCNPFADLPDREMIPVFSKVD